jgi:hypothetical protein
MLSALGTAAAAYWKYETEKLAVKRDIAAQQVYSDDALHRLVEEVNSLKEKAHALETEAAVHEVRLDHVESAQERLLQAVPHRPVVDRGALTVEAVLEPLPEPKLVELPSRSKYQNDPRVQQVVEARLW